MMLLPLTMSAQDKKEVVEYSVDRPSTCAGSGITPKGKVLWEVGMNYNHDTAEKVDGEEVTPAISTFTFMNSLVRYGLLDNVELRLQWDLMHQRIHGVKDNGVGPLTLGTKVKFFDGKGYIPAISLLTNVTFPLASKTFRPANIAPSVILLADHNISDNVGLTYNTGLLWDGGDSHPATLVAVCSSYTITPRVGCFLESYNYFKAHTNPSFNANVGGTYQITPRVRADASIFCNVNRGNNVGFNLGVAWLIN